MEEVEVEVLVVVKMVEEEVVAKMILTCPGKV